MAYSDDGRYSYVPAKITVGMFNGSNGFVTCKYNNEKWVQLGVFERLCKFKPHRQMSCETELKKAMSGAVFEHDNVPTEGFKYVKACTDLYTLHHRCSDRGDVIIEDPRGFKIAITDDNFYSVLESSGFNVKNGVICRKLAYAWNDGNTRFRLVDAETAEFSEIQKKSSKIIKKVDTTAYLAKKQLQVGHVYESKTGEKLMYMGVHPTYSGDCHLDAIDTGCYSLDFFIGSRTDCTRTAAFVFFKLDSNAPSNSRYLLAGSCSKMLTRELDFDCSNVNFNGMPCTFSNIAADMEVNPLFNKLDVKCLTSSPSTELLSYDAFTRYVFLCNYCAVVEVPQGFSSKTQWHMSKTFGVVQHALNYRYDKRITFRERRTANLWGYSWQNAPREHSYYDFEAKLAYSQLQLLVPVLFYENGNRVREEHALLFYSSYAKKR